MRATPRNPLKGPSSANGSFQDRLMAQQQAGSREDAFELYQIYKPAQAAGASSPIPEIAKAASPAVIASWAGTGMLHPPVITITDIPSSPSLVEVEVRGASLNDHPAPTVKFVISRGDLFRLCSDAYESLTAPDLNERSHPVPGGWI